MSTPQHEAFRDLSRRRRTLHLRPDHLLHMLHLPESTVVLHIVGSTDPTGINIIVADPQFTPVQDEATAPMLSQHVTVEADGGQITVTYVDHETGKPVS